jgi:hypothetical protein
MSRFIDFSMAIAQCHQRLKDSGQMVPVRRWQGVDTEGEFLEVTFHSFSVHQVPSNLDVLRKQIQPNLPWADDHFLERVGGEPLNPGEQYKNWPYWTEESESISLKDGKFSHTYMQRFWPDDGGNLNDVVSLLRRDPYTRQAYVPIWFPEDTGAVSGERVPCTLGYFFLMRNGKLHMRYHIRSCDLTRYLRDDIYMAVRLQLWVLEQLEGHIAPGEFHMDIDSLHIFGRDFATT